MNKGKSHLPIYLLCVFLLHSLLGEVGKVVAYSSRKPLKCRLEVVKVLEATIGRGPPYLTRILERDPAHAEPVTGESHGDHHLNCVYEILMGSHLYRYREEFSDTFLDLKEDYCGRPLVRKKVRESILQFTQGCKQPNARPALGYPLESL